jgi:Flp pilus assembly protein TadD
MSRMLSLFDDGLAAAAHLFQTGRTTRAAATLTQLRGGAGTTADAVKVLRAAAAVAVTAEKYRRARKLLREAIALAPTDAGLWFEMGRAFEDDPHGCDRKAVRRYKKAAQLNANDPKHKAVLGRAMVRINEIGSGVRQLCRAAEAAPTDADVLGVVAEGLREAGRAELAFQLLSKARFLAPADRGIEHLWSRAKFDMLAQQQKGGRGTTPTSIPMLRVFNDAPTPDVSNSPRTPYRADNTHSPTPHIARLRAFRSDMG